MRIFSYGPKSSAELLLLYGFVADRNPYDSVEIYVSPDPSDPLFERKKEYLVSSGLDIQSSFPLYGDRYPMELIEYLRFCVANEEQLETADFGGFICEENESLVARALTEACQVAIESYPQSAEEDKALMSDRGMWNMLSIKARCAIRQRMAEKVILRRTVSNIMKEAAEPSFLFAGPSSGTA
jgi:protein-histidine N-methyltransferase